MREGGGGILAKCLLEKPKGRSVLCRAGVGETWGPLAGLGVGFMGAEWGEGFRSPLEVSAGHRLQLLHLGPVCSRPQSQSLCHSQNN